jgi:hypothetical protein
LKSTEERCVECLKAISMDDVIMHEDSGRY